MILDTLNNLEKYYPLHGSFSTIINFLNKDTLEELKPGRYELKDGVYTIVNKYLTKDISECFIECHKKYIDVQIVTKGVELVGICSKQDCFESLYDEEKDFQKLVGEVDFITLKEGYFVIFFPQDGHMPQVKINHNSEEVKKVVYKILV